MKQFKNLGLLAAIIVTPAMLNFAFISEPTNAELNELTTYKNFSFIEPATTPIETEMSIFKLWENDIALSNEAILCFSEDDSHAQQSLNELCVNKSKLNLLIQSNYGKNTRVKFAQLLASRILTTFDLAIAIKNKNELMILASTRNLGINNDEISQLLEKSETTKRLSEMKMMMNDHSKNIQTVSNVIINIEGGKPVLIEDTFLEDSIPQLVLLDTTRAHHTSDTSSTRFENHTFKIVLKKNPTN